LFSIVNRAPGKSAIENRENKKIRRDEIENNQSRLKLTIPCGTLLRNKWS
jgi:hypothetical protein